jgi:hypothetical protein
MKGNIMFDDIQEINQPKGHVFIGFTNEYGVTTTKQYEFTEVTWHNHLQHFVELLEGVGFTGARERVAIVRNSDELCDYDYLTETGWFGPSVSPEETNEQYVRPAPVYREPKSSKDKLSW